jgi:hypothetical protein
MRARCCVGFRRDSLNPDKVTLGDTEIKYLGHLISHAGLVCCPTGWQPSSATRAPLI